MNVVIFKTKSKGDFIAGPVNRIYIVFFIAAMMFSHHISMVRHHTFPTHPDFWKNIKNSRGKLSLKKIKNFEKSKIDFFLFSKISIFVFFQTKFYLWVLNIFQNPDALESCDDVRSIHGEKQSFPDVWGALWPPTETSNGWYRICNGRYRICNGRGRICKSDQAKYTSKI